MVTIQKTRPPTIKRSFIKHNIIPFKIVEQSEFNRNCKDCKYSFQENNYSVCRLFKYPLCSSEDYDVITDFKNYFESNDNHFHYYIETNACRSDETLCGPDGEYFKPKN